MLLRQLSYAITMGSGWNPPYLPYLSLCPEQALYGLRELAYQLYENITEKLSTNESAVMLELDQWETGLDLSVQATLPDDHHWPAGEAATAETGRGQGSGDNQELEWSTFIGR